MKRYKKYVPKNMNNQNADESWFDNFPKVDDGSQEDEEVINLTMLESPEGKAELMGKLNSNFTLAKATTLINELIRYYCSLSEYRDKSEEMYDRTAGLYIYNMYIEELEKYAEGPLHSEEAKEHYQNYVGEFLDCRTELFNDILISARKD